jgi:prevent-host-death family protein
MQPAGNNESIVVSALTARTGFDKLLRRVEDEHRSHIIAKRGAPKAVLLSIRDYVKLAAPEPEVRRVVGKESRRRGTDKLTSRQIDQIIKTTRGSKRKRNSLTSCRRTWSRKNVGRAVAGADLLEGAKALQLAELGMESWRAVRGGRAAVSITALAGV